jgi:hypothetical protein
MMKADRFTIYLLVIAICAMIYANEKGIEKHQKWLAEQDTACKTTPDKCHKPSSDGGPW